ncbi:MAG: DMT family transporter [Burkholderiaceae bacterium]|jgi:drug/metabolite transporter (DMT)-like permease|nr:DMT family transporter [Burkholderiaceae bacterium]
MSVSMHTRLDGRAIAMLLICCVIWGVQQALVKATLPYAAPIFQASLRFIGGAILLWLWCRARHVPLFNADGSLWPGLLAGVLFTSEFVALYLGLMHTTAGRLTVFLYTAPFWIALLLPLWVPAERLRGSQWAGLACAFVAVAFALREGFLHGAAGLTWRGDLLGLIGGLFWGLTTVVLRATRLTQSSPEKVLFYQVATAAVALPLLSLALGETWTWRWGAFAATSVTLQAVVGAFASYLAWQWLLMRYPATRLAAFIFLAPLFTLITGALWLREPLSGGLVLAMALVAAGIVLVNRRTAVAEEVVIDEVGAA